MDLKDVGVSSEVVESLRWIGADQVCLGLVMEVFDKL